jgi:multiple sugar transport system permease protein
VIYLAALQGVPQHLYEAARIDGAGRWGQFRYITLPMVSPTTFFMLIMGLIGAFQVFEQIMIMTGGGPMRATYVVYMYMYDYAFRYSEMGYAAAVGYIMAIIIFILTVINMKVSGKFVHYE